MNIRTSITSVLTLVVILLSAAVMPGAQTLDPKLAIADTNGTTLWYDGKLLGVEGKGWENTESYYDRLPSKAKGVAPESVWNLGHHSAGMCFRFTTDSSSLHVRWTLINKDLAMPHMPATGVSGVDLYAKDKSGKCRFVGNGRPTQVTNTATFTLTPGGEYVLYLPLYNGVQSVELGVPKDKALSKSAPPSGKSHKPIVFYGTSITQGGCVSRPGMAATSIVGRELDVPVINLGFSGSGKMEPEMSDLLAELDPSVYVLDCIWNMTPDMVTARVEPFVRKLRSVHPDTPILLAEDSSFKNTTPTEKGRLLRVVYENLKKAGVKNIHFLSNADMLGRDSEGTVDGCHPNDLGMMRQAEVFTKALRPILRNAE